MILRSNGNGEYILKKQFPDLESAQWELELEGYKKDSETYFYKGVGRDAETSTIYKVVNEDLMKIEVDGKKYTVKEASEKFGVSSQNLYTRYKRGLRGKHLIMPVTKRSRNGRKVVFNGKEYKNVKDCSEKTGLTEQQVRYGINTGKGYFMEEGLHDGKGEQS